MGPRKPADPHASAGRKVAPVVAPVLALALGLTTAACDGPEPALARREFAAFGTEMRVTLADVPRERAARAADDVERFFHSVDRDWYAFGDGELARVNDLLSKGESAELSASLAALIARSIELHRWTGGDFDPAVCALVRLWHFDGEPPAGPRRPPAAGDVAALRRDQGTLADVSLSGRTLTTRRPLCIDLGGLAKGTALERTRVLLEAAGVRNALVDLGGSSVLALGTRPVGAVRRPWRIGLKDPRGPSVIAALDLEPGQVATTSGDDVRAFSAGGRRYAHVLDPKSGNPAPDVASVTVLTTDAERGEAATKALMVSGPARFDARVAELGLVDALMITTAGRLLATPSMRERLLAANDGQLPGIAWARADL